MSIGVKIFSGRASKQLAEQIAGSYGVPLGDVKVMEFSDGEFQPSFEETVDKMCSLFNPQCHQVTIYSNYY
jgi:ribose-phosphate pyrophosphokinase